MLYKVLKYLLWFLVAHEIDCCRAWVIYVSFGALLAVVFITYLYR